MTSPEILCVIFPVPSSDRLQADLLRRKKKHLKTEKYVFTLCFQAEIGGEKEQGLSCVVW